MHLAWLLQTVLQVRVIARWTLSKLNDARERDGERVVNSAAWCAAATSRVRRWFPHEVALIGLLFAACDDGAEAWEEAHREAMQGHEQALRTSASAMRGELEPALAAAPASPAAFGPGADAGDAVAPPSAATDPPMQELLLDAWQQLQRSVDGQDP